MGKANLVDITCAFCEKVIKGDPQKKYCGWKCIKYARNVRTLGWLKITCGHCKKLMSSPFTDRCARCTYEQDRWKDRQAKVKPVITLTCRCCNTEFVKTANKQVYCPDCRKSRTTEYKECKNCLQRFRSKSEYCKYCKDSKVRSVQAIQVDSTVEKAVLYKLRGQTVKIFKVVKLNQLSPLEALLAVKDKVSAIWDKPQLFLPEYLTGSSSKGAVTLAYDPEVTYYKFGDKVERIRI